MHKDVLLNINILEKYNCFLPFIMLEYMCIIIYILTLNCLAQNYFLKYYINILKRGVEK